MRPIRFAFLIGQTALLAGVALGCVRLERPYPARRLYLLEASRGDVARRVARAEMISVRTFRAVGAFAGSGLVYRKAGSRYESDYYNQFFVAPDRMITDQAIRWLEESGLFGHVVTTSGQVQAGYVLEGSIAALYGDYTVPARPRAVLEVQFLLLKAQDGPARIVFQRNYRAEAPLAGSEPQQLVAGLTDALCEVLTRFEEELASPVLEL